LLMHRPIDSPTLRHDFSLPSSIEQNILDSSASCTPTAIKDAVFMAQSKSARSPPV
jgi:hypothetical protein